MVKTRLIYRAEHSKENPYFQMLRAAAQNRELTFEARGVLAYILSKPDDWKVQPSDLEQQCKKSVVYRVLAELIKHGYINRVQERNDKKQIIAWHYLVHEYPLPRKQEVALPEVAKLEVVKTDITEYREEQKKEKKQPASKRERKPDPIYDAIAKVWGLTASGQIVSMKSMMTGIAKRGTWQDCNFEPPITDAQEILDFEVYMIKRMREINITQKPTAAVTIQRWFYDFRLIASRRTAIIAKRAENPLMDLSIPQPVTPKLLEREEAS